MSDRRQARARTTPVGTRIEGFDAPVPIELLDGDHPMWSDTALYRKWCADHQISLPASERFGVATHPHNRRNRAAADWAVLHGPDKNADWNLLRRLGLIGDA